MDEDFVPTRAAKLKRNAEKMHEVTVYESHKKVPKLLKTHHKKENNRSDKFEDSCDSMGEEDNVEPLDPKRKQELEMKRYRYEVIKLGMSGFEKRKAKEAKIALAISLGAKPPKNKRKNYKKLIAERQLDKAREAKKAKFVSGFNPKQLTKNKKNNRTTEKNQNHKKGKQSSGILDIYGKVTKDNKTRRKSGKGVNKHKN